VKRATTSGFERPDGFPIAVVSTVKFDDTVVVTIGHENGTVPKPLWIVLMVDDRRVATSHVIVTVEVGELTLAFFAGSVRVAVIFVYHLNHTLATLNDD
jgi:hypothetical protein